MTLLKLNISDACPIKFISIFPAEDVNLSEAGLPWENDGTVIIIIVKNAINLSVIVKDFVKNY
jgi:hypothetical protein